jgi:pSer/pThr/pTyr-binding forkhead associated (FHA) protein
MNQVSSRRDSSVLQVFIFRDGRFWGTECFNQSNIVIGRSPEVDLELEDDVISRSHAAVNVTSKGLMIKDLGSSNGTFVNGENVSHCEVDSRDEISIGSFLLKFKLLGKKKPKGRFKDKTRIIENDQDELERDDLTERVELDHAEEQDSLDDDLDTQQNVRRDSLEDIPAREKEAESSLAGLIEDSVSDLGGIDEQSPKEQSADSLNRLMERDPLRQLQDQSFAEPEIKEDPLTVVDPMMSEAGILEGGEELDLAASQDSSKLQLDLDRESMPEPIAESRPRPAPTPEEPEPPLEGDFGPYDGEEEDDEAQPDFVEPFSLLNNLIRENFSQPSVNTRPTSAIEVIRYSSEKEIISYTQVEPKKRYRLDRDKFVLVHYNDQSSCKLMFTDSFSGGVIAGGQTIAIDELKTSSNLHKTKKGVNIYAYRMMKGDYANLVHEGGGSFLRFVNPPKIPPVVRKFKLDPMDMKIFGSSFLAHILLVIIVGIFSKNVTAAYENIDRFAKVDLKDIEMEKPDEMAEIPLDQLPEPEIKEEEVPEPEVPKEEPKEEPKEVKPEPKKQPKAKPAKSRRRSKKKGGGGGGGGGDGGGGGGVGMMAALGNLSQKKSSSNIVAAVSNLDAVRVPGGRSRYKVSGLVAKLPTSGVVVSRGRGAGVKAGIDLLRGGKGRGGRAGIGPGGLGGGRTGKRGVGGVVFKAPKRKMRVRGTLSREAIAAVVKKNLRAVQYCYEKNLMANNKLAGKVIMEWTISTSGSVSVVKTKTNTMQSPAVAMCIAAKIKGWKFPKPKGGIVVVAYPFIFNSIGF